MIPWTFQKMNLFLIFTFYYKYLKYKNYFNLGIETVFHLKYNHINGLVGVLNGKAERPAWTRTANGANKRLVLHMQLRCGSLAITSGSDIYRSLLLANEFDVWSVLHGQVSLAAVNRIGVIHEAMNGCKNLKFIKGLFRKCKYASNKRICWRIQFIYRFKFLSETLSTSILRAFEQWRLWRVCAYAQTRLKLLCSIMWYVSKSCALAHLLKGTESL